MNEIKRLQQLAGITEIKVNNPTILKLKVETLYDNEDEHGFEYVDIGVGGFYYDGDQNMSSMFDMGDEDAIEDFNKLIKLLKDSNIKDYNIDDDEDTKWINVPLKHANFVNSLDEIKISNPIPSSQQIIELYNKIDNYLDTIWEFDDFGEDQNPIANNLDKKLNNIIKTIGPSYLPSTKIESMIPSDPLKKSIFYQKLKELDSTIDYNYTV